MCKYILSMTLSTSETLKDNWDRHYIKFKIVITIIEHVMACLKSYTQCLYQRADQICRHLTGYSITAAAAVTLLSPQPHPFGKTYIKPS